VIRDYERLRFYMAGAAEHKGAVLREVPGARVNLRPLREAQGEGVAFAGGGTLVLTSEGGLHGGPASIRTIDCSVGFARWGISPVAGPPARRGAPPLRSAARDLVEMRDAANGEPAIGDLHGAPATAHVSDPAGEGAFGADRSAR
jgi:hypothetical protein